MFLGGGSDKHIEGGVTLLWVATLSALTISSILLPGVAKEATSVWAEPVTGTAVGLALVTASVITLESGVARGTFLVDTGGVFATNEVPGERVGVATLSASTVSSIPPGALPTGTTSFWTEPVTTTAVGFALVTASVIKLESIRPVGLIGIFASAITVLLPAVVGS